jgi:valyl-tRNA synthetase
MDKSDKEIYVGLDNPNLKKYTKAILLHAWGSDPEKAFFPWLKEELESRGLEVVAPKLPNAKNPDFDEWLKKLEEIGTDEQTLIIGRSLGGTLALAAAMRGNAIGKLIDVCTPLENEAIPEFFEKIGKWDFEKIRKNIKESVVIHSSNDPYIPNKTSEKISKELNAPLVVVEDADHFTDENYPEILNACDLWNQDPDTFDTWFSSGQWAYTTLGFSEKNPGQDFLEYYPSDTMIMGRDILPFWAFRMIVLSLYRTRQVPFKNLYFTGLVRDEHGQKMSKSKGNGIEPLEMIEKYGTDAVRLALVIGSAPGNDLNLGESKIEGQRNFITKLWNVARFILEQVSSSGLKAEAGAALKDLTPADAWIIGKMNDLIQGVQGNLENYQFSLAAEKLREFTWHSLADWYLEVSKIEQNPAKNLLLYQILQDLLRLWHPFIPFVTERIWSELDNDSDLLMTDSWPQANFYEEVLKSKELAPRSAEEFELAKEVITAIRAARAENKVEPKRKIGVVIYAQSKEKIAALEKQRDLITGARTGIEESKLEIKTTGPKIKQAILAQVTQFDEKIDIYLLDALDQEKEKQRLNKEIQALEKVIPSLEKKLANPAFVQNAPKEVVKAEKAKLDQWQAKLTGFKKQLEELGN